jgi:hypothetical protein
MIDKRTLTKLAALREALAAADGERDGSFSRVFSSFLDLADEPALLRGSKPAKSPLVKGALERLAGQLVDDASARIQNVRMLRFAEGGLLHGGFFVGASMGSFFFFEKEEQGLLAVHQGGAMMLYTRVTMTRLPPGTMPAPRPEGTQ